MFEQTFIDTQAQSRKPWTVGVSLSIQSVIILALLIVPLLRIPKLIAPDRTPLWIPLITPTPAHPPEPAAKPQPHTSAARVRRVMPNLLVAPTHIPRAIDMTPDAPTMPAAIGLPDQTSGVMSALTSNISLAPPKPAQQPTVKPAVVAPPSIVHASMGVQSAKLIFGPKPAYPPLARAARVEGIVRLRATIAADGSIRDLQAVSGPPLLIQAAMEAVRQWRYQPTLLSGQPVEVMTEIEVNFTLSR